MTPDEALDVLKREAKYRVFGIHARDDMPPSVDEHRQALATLDGLHAHWSRFKVGDEVWVASEADNLPLVVYGVSYCDYDDNHRGTYYAVEGFGGGKFVEHESKCFPTRELAEAECARRNEKS